jgi:8-oxo-dGTP pyrophosphatase MutT (NUDIX family)
MGLKDHAQFQVATKALLTNSDGRILVLITPDGYVDFPGGRVDNSELELSWHDALKRELSEEIGTSIQVDIGQTLFVSKRRYHLEGPVKYIAAIFFACTLAGGDTVVLSEEHSDHAWMTPAELLAIDREFISEDERSQLRNYYAK